MNKDPPAYTIITDTLRRSIRQKSLIPGTVLLEGPIASIFGSSRAPVKQALSRLREEGLISRFDGRGMIVGGGIQAIKRLPLTAEILGLSQESPSISRVRAWQKIYQTIERDLIYRSVFGRFRVNEFELARHYKVGRTVAHEALTQLQSTGIVTKGEKAHWLIVPLDDKRLHDLYDLRELLEPVLMARATTKIPSEELRQMKARVRAAMKQYPKVAATLLDELETDIHVGCLSYGGNVEMLEALKRTRCILISGKHILGEEIPYPKVDPFMREHLRILDALSERDAKGARVETLAHLALARKKVAERLRTFRKNYSLPPVAFATEG